MQTIDNSSNHHNIESYLFLANDNQLDNIIEICSELNQLNINNNGKNDEHESIVNKDHSELRVEEESSKVMEILIQDEMSNYYFENNHKEDSLFY